ncbi:MAG: TusE/DsrC/DsvC family sulfur relay protein [Gammaproteobacteria bacterium]|nr:MAG: TusE/DsrC/DsvC family sulfur relay protein [Gammaproteobacteria bacterium]
MSDSGDFIEQYDRPAVSDPSDPFAGLDPWDEEKARQLAAEEGIELTDDHWQILRALRAHYAEREGKLQAVETLRFMEEQVRSHQLKDLYKLFPNGPVRQATKIAGIPTPHEAVDPHFGSVM